MIKAVFIDWYKTLSSSIFWEPLKETSKRKFKLITRTYLDIFGDLIEPWMKGKYSSEQICAFISQEVGIDHKIVYGEFIKSVEMMKFDSEDFIPLIKKLRDKDIRVVIATDNMDSFNRWTTPSLKLNKYFDDILNSYNIGSLKNEIRTGRSGFFNDYLFNNNIELSQSLLIDDKEPKNLIKLGLNYHPVKSPDDVLIGLRSVLNQN